MKIKKDEYNNTTYQFKQKVSENNQVYLCIGKGFDNKLFMRIHNGDDDEQNIEIEGIEFPDLNDKGVEYRLDINCNESNISDKGDELLTLEI